jgi:hypothetical protein
MEKDYLILKRTSASRPSGEWNDDDFDVVANGKVVGRILKVNAGRNEVARETVSTEEYGRCPQACALIFVFPLGDAMKAGLCEDASVRSKEWV